MFYKIVGSNKHELAYAEKLKSIKLLPDCRVYCEPFRGSCFFADVNEIIQDPEIIHEVAGGSLYKIRLVPAGSQGQEGDGQDQEDLYHTAKLQLSSVYGRCAREDDCMDRIKPRSYYHGLDRPFTYRCGHCFHSLKENDHFCSGCGKGIDWE